MYPILQVTLKNRNPSWKPVYDSNGKATNLDTSYVTSEVEVEVIQLNLSSETMRVRYQWPSDNKKGYTVETRDLSIEPFYEQYQVVKK